MRKEITILSAAAALSAPHHRPHWPSPPAGT